MRLYYAYLRGVVMIFKGCGYGFLQVVVMLWVFKGYFYVMVFKRCGYVMGI